MTYEEQIKRWDLLAKAKAIPDAAAHPPLDRCLRNLGLEVRPFMFWSFPWMMFALGEIFGIFWGLFMFVAVWSDRPFWIAMAIGQTIGLTFGLIMATYFSWQARKWRLPSWEELTSESKI